MRDMHPASEECGCYGCVLKMKGSLVGIGAMPTRRNPIPPSVKEPVWEKGNTGTYRNDGGFMPNVSPDLSRIIKVKEYSENRHRFEAERHRLRNDPTPERTR